MATIDFPTSPIVGQTYLFGGRTWQWTGTGWMRVVNASQVVSVFTRLFPLNLAIDQAIPYTVPYTWTQLIHL